MKTLFTLLVLVCFSMTAAQAQNSTANIPTKKVVAKQSLKKVAPTPVQHKNVAVDARKDRSERIDVNSSPQVVEMTDEYIDTKIAEIDKFIAGHQNQEGFNRAGYEQRKQYLESRRPKK